MTETGTYWTGRSGSSRTPGSRGCTSFSPRPTRPPATPGSRRSQWRPAPPGLEIGRIEPKMGIKGSTTGEVFLTGCRVPVANRLGAEVKSCAHRDADSRPVAARYRRAGARHRRGRHRLRARFRAHARDDGAADRQPPARRRDARRHGDAMRGGARAALPLRRADRLGRRRAGAEEAVGDHQALLLGHGDGSDDRRGAGARRIRVHEGVPGGTDDAGREDHPDLRGNESGPAAGDRARDGPRGPRHSFSRDRVKLSSRDRVLFPDDGITKGNVFDLLRGGRAHDPAASAGPAVHDEALARGARGRGRSKRSRRRRGCPTGSRPDEFRTYPREGGSRDSSTSPSSTRRMRSSGWCRCTAST